MFILANVKVDGALCRIGIAIVDYFLDEIDDLRDMFSDSCEVGG